MREIVAKSLIVLLVIEHLSWGCEQTIVNSLQSEVIPMWALLVFSLRVIFGED